jgi:glycosyltransferase involved in cell wall biosynthesis
MKKLLVVIQFIRRGGVENVAINYAMHLDKSKYQVSFLCVGVNDGQDLDYKSYIQQNGYNIYEIPCEINGYYKKFRYLCKFFKQHHYDIVHSHTIFFSAIVLLAAKKNKIPVRVSHSHISMWNHEENLKYKLYKRVMRFLLNRVSNRKLACSEAAGVYLYGKKEYVKNGMFVANGIDTEKFSYNFDFRRDIRDEFDVSDNEILFGHIGTIYEIKNQSFIVKVMAEYMKVKPSCKLILVGEKVDTSPVIETAKEYGILDRVIFTGQRSDVYKFYSAFDIMIFPSLHEGLPVSLIEAQASKLPCLISDTVTREVSFNSNILFESLDSSLNIWANDIMNLITLKRDDVDINSLLTKYDISNVVTQLDSIYV